MGRATGNPNASPQPVKPTAETIRNGTYQKSQAEVAAKAAERSETKQQVATDTKTPAAIDMGKATALTSRPFPSFSLKSFPSDIDQQRNFKLYFYDYTRTTFEQPASLTGKECIILPLPSNLTEKTSPSWDAKALGALGGAAMSGVNRFMGGMESKTTGSLREQTLAGVASLKSWGKQTVTSPEAMLAAVSIGVKAMNETMGNMFDLASGTTPNPHLTMLFKGVNLRQHQFKWRFAPESEEESKSLRNIITTLKAISLPNKGQFLLGYPGIVKPEISIDGSLYTELYSMKECVIMGVDVNYAPSGVPAFFADTGAPVEVELTLSLQEVRIVTRDDYESEMNEIVSDPPGVDDPSAE